MDVSFLSSHVAARLTQDEGLLKQMWAASSPVKYFYIDDLFPYEIAAASAEGFPQIERMNRRSSIREKKYTSARMDVWGESTRNIFLALQSKMVMSLVTRITGIENLTGDPDGYAGGVSAMLKGDFLNPHLDNSCHPKISGYRRLNSLYYVTENWSESNGGNLELWSNNLKKRVEITSKFNRLIVMNTNNQSLHSVNKLVSTGTRKCISNYYFNQQSPSGKEYHHITSFRGRPGEVVKDLYLRIEGIAGSYVQTIIGKPIKKGEK